MSVPSVSSNALGYGAFLGIYANLRYQLLCGFDRAMVSHFDVIGVALFFSTVSRSALPPYQMSCSSNCTCIVDCFLSIYSEYSYTGS